jgi:hypothetical protein
LQQNIQKFLLKTGNAAGTFRVSSKKPGNLAQWRDWQARFSPDLRTIKPSGSGASKVVILGLGMAFWRSRFLMREISRRSAGALAGAALAGAALPARAEESRKPNVLVILGDDLGWGNLSCYGSPNISTPNLDALATQGIRFTDGYSAAAVCSPTRFALYTGRYPGRLRGGLAEPIARPNELEGLPADHPTLASLLQQAGYATAMYGKWHCGYLPWYSVT